MSDKGSAPARTDLTQTHYRGFVRKDEEWPEDSEQYKAGNQIENRKRPPPDEIPGDAFDRQRVIPGFDHGLIERQVCLVLGAGGIGQDVALTLGRLGVQKIILVDCDVYDATNLTRQCLGGKADVGDRKVDVAARGLRNCHNLRSEIEAVHCDAILEWPRIVDLARQATVVFNGIDVGVMWDFCVNSLCKELGLPLCAGQSFGWKFMTELYTGKATEVCAFCYDSTSSTFGASERAVTMKRGILERCAAFLAASGRSGDVSAQCLVAFLAQDRQFRCTGSAQIEAVVSASLRRIGRAHLDEAALATELLEFLKAYQAEVTQRLLPGCISSLADVAFIPRPKHAETRYVGSWVCPCLGCAVTLVSQWTALLTAPVVEGQASPQAVTFNLDCGMTSEEQLGYELGALGVSLDKAERRFCRDASKAECEICAAAAGLQAEESLFTGRLPVVLSPVPGQVLGMPGSWLPPAPPADARREEATKVALARRSPLASLGDEYANTVVPAMPALDWERSGAADEQGSSIWPLEISNMALLKVPPTSEAATAPSALRGVASGVRSALVKARGRWWRLKGCGNRDQGFPVEVKGDQGELNVRGCCFKHTADTELRMTALAEEALSAAGLDCANKSAGSYQYAHDPAWPLPKIDRFCAVFETLGNARLGDHLLGGLLLLLPHLVPVPSAEGFAALRSAIAAGRGAAEADELLSTADLACCGMPTADVAKQLAAANALLVEAAPPAASTADNQTSCDVPQELHSVWNATRQRLASALPDALAAAGEPSLLLWLAWRLGWEAGETLRALHGAGIAWGTYPDSMGIHCNAHVNNLVVKPPGVGRSNTFLAALDFDMAFTRDGFLAEACKNHAGLGLDNFDGVLAFEASMGMKTVLSGSTFASTGVSNSAAAPESHSIVEMAIRDTLVTAYESAFAGSGEDAHPPQDAMMSVAYDVIKLALCFTTHVEG